MLVCALAPAVGPSLGGFIVGQFGWRMIFVALAPGLLFSLAAGIYAIRQSSPYGPRAFDFSGLGCLAVAFSCLLLLCSYASSLPLLPCLGLAVMGLLAVGIFLRQETCLLQQGKAPLLCSIRRPLTGRCCLCFWCSSCAWASAFCCPIMRSWCFGWIPFPPAASCCPDVWWGRPWLR